LLDQRTIRPSEVYLGGQDADVSTLGPTTHDALDSALINDEAID